MDMFDKAKDAMKTAGEKAEELAAKAKVEAEKTIKEVKDSGIIEKADAALHTAADKTSDAVTSAVYKAEEAIKVDLNMDGSIGAPKPEEPTLPNTDEASSS